MQDPPCNEGEGHVVVKAHKVLAIEVARTEEVPAIEAERTGAEPFEVGQDPTGEGGGRGGRRGGRRHCLQQARDVRQAHPGVGRGKSPALLLV